MNAATNSVVVQAFRPAHTTRVQRLTTDTTINAEHAEHAESGSRLTAAHAVNAANAATDSVVVQAFRPAHTTRVQRLTTTQRSTQSTRSTQRIRITINRGARSERSDLPVVDGRPAEAGRYDDHDPVVTVVAQAFRPAHRRSVHL